MSEVIPYLTENMVPGCKKRQQVNTIY